MGKNKFQEIFGSVGKSGNICTKVINMSNELESVKLKKNKVKKVRDNKKITGVPISTFIEKLIDTALPDKPKK